MAPEFINSLPMVVGLVADPMKKATSCIRKRSLVKTDKARLSSQERAEEIQSSLNPKFPSFIKLMLHSHVTGGFWLGLPAQFCYSYLPREVVAFSLLDENGEEYPVKYLPNKLGLSGGWKGFAIVHKLVEGDALVFQLVKVTKFKVYIVRAYGSAEVDGALGLLKLEAPAKETDSDDAGKVIKTTKKPALKHVKFLPSVDFYGDSENIRPQLSGSDNLPVKVTKTSKKPAQKRAKFHPSVVFYGDDQNVSPKLSGSDKLPVKIMKTTKKPAEKRAKFHPLSVSHGNDKNVSSQLSCSHQPENQSEVVIDSEVLEGIKLSSSIVEFQDIKNLASFNITVNGLIIDSEVSKQVRTKYYELCCSQNSFLHEHLVQGLNYKLSAGMISETVNIADAIRASNLSTSRDEFAKWENSLKAFKQLGMNVDFLLSRLEQIVNMAFESEDAVDARRYRKAMIGRTRAKEEMRTIEMKLVELKDASKKFEKELKTLKLKVNTEKFELKFHAEVNAPW